MIKDAIEKIISLAAPMSFEVGGRHYTTQNAHEIMPGKNDTLGVTSLDGLCEWILNSGDEDHNFSAIVRDPSHVECVAPVDDYGRRAVIAKADCSNVLTSERPILNTGVEEFIIALRTQFVPSPDVDMLIAAVSSLAVDTEVRAEDDGITQTATVKAGISRKANATLRPIVELAPYRTFFEVEQPKSSYLFRLSKGGNGPLCSLYRADGNAWVMTAMRAIKAHIEARFIADGVDGIEVLI